MRCPHEYANGAFGTVSICACVPTISLLEVSCCTSDKVEKIVQGQFDLFQTMYKPFLEEYLTNDLLRFSSSEGHQVNISQALHEETRRSCPISGSSQQAERSALKDILVRLWTEDVVGHVRLDVERDEADGETRVGDLFVLFLVFEDDPRQVHLDHLRVLGLLPVDVGVGYRRRFAGQARAFATATKPSNGSKISSCMLPWLFAVLYYLEKEAAAKHVPQHSCDGSRKK
ncbi:hypothetical protein RJ639_032640 [Escallonia herrerae]|uniref:Uncharacterized protein n=1 Tax=Escallonia herrerae TaxID=1293975 RepID=A0AA88X1F2_9ASTE|nr:hypothetical protein RJ639_032640 [Escallonia herrerae]